MGELEPTPPGKLHTNVHIHIYIYVVMHISFNEEIYTYIMYPHMYMYVCVPEILTVSLNITDFLPLIDSVGASLYHSQPCSSFAGPVP